MKPLATLLLCLGASLLVFAFLYLSAGDPPAPKNGFVRRVLRRAAIPQGQVDLGATTYYLAGLTSASAYLGSYAFPGRLLRVPHTLTDHTLIQLDIPPEKMAWRSLRAQVDSPRVWLTERISPAYIQTQLPRGPTTFFRFDSSVRFDLIQPIAPGSFITRTYDPVRRQNSLAKISHRGPAPVSYPLPKQIDGVFCSDGMLRYHPASGQLLYIYYYRGEFACLDTTLRLRYRAKTIDTVTTARLAVARYRRPFTDRQDSRLQAPAPKVNRKSAVSEAYLFIESGLPADQESPQEFNRVSTLDVYALADARYQFSLRIPHYQNQPLKDFLVQRQRLWALHGPYLVVYTLRFPPLTRPAPPGSGPKAPPD